MEVLSNIGFDWQVALSNFVSFVLIYFILKTWVFGPVSDILEQRKSTIEEGVKKAKESEAVLTQAQEEADTIIKTSKQEANIIVAKAKDSGDELITNATKQAEKEAHEVHIRAKQALQKEQEDMEQALISKTASLVSMGVTKLLKEEVDQKRDQELTNRALKHLQNVSSVQK